MKSPLTARPIAVALLLSALLAGCGGSSSNNDSASSAPADEKTPQMRCAPAPASGQSCAS